MKNLLILFIIPIFCNSQIIFNTPFESTSEFGTTTPFWRTDIPGNTTNYQLVGNPRQGSTCLRLQAYTTIRNEIVRQLLFDWDEEYWVGYSIKVVTKVAGFEIITQHRPEPSCGPNSLTIRTLSNNRLQFLTSTNPDLVNATPTSSAAIWGGVSHETTYTPGAWHDVVMHFKLTAGSTGYYELWVDGVKLIDVDNQSTVYTKSCDGTNKLTYDYAKIGTYHGPDATQGEIHYDAYKVWEGTGGTYEDVSPLGLSVEGTNPAPPGGTDPPQTVIQNSRRKLKNLPAIIF